VGVCAGDLDEEGGNLDSWRFAVGYQTVNGLTPLRALVEMHGLERRYIFGLEDVINIVMGSM
jgi:hypothetical protein